MLPHMASALGSAGLVVAAAAGRQQHGGRGHHQRGKPRLAVILFMGSP
jgi:hypothetical protein